MHIMNKRFYKHVGPQKFPKNEIVKFQYGNFTPFGCPQQLNFIQFGFSLHLVVPDTKFHPVKTSQTTAY